MKLKEATVSRSESSASLPGKGAGGLSRTAYLLAAVALFIVTSIIAFNQPAGSDESQTGTGLIPWLFYPVERNSPKWIVGADLNAVYALDANRVWAVGNKGLIMYSGDGGSTWIKQPGGPASPTTSPSPPPSPTPTLTPSPPANANVPPINNANANTTPPNANTGSEARSGVKRSHGRNIKGADANRELAHASQSDTQNSNSSAPATNSYNPRTGRRRAVSTPSNTSDNASGNPSGNGRRTPSPAANRTRQPASRRPATVVSTPTVTMAPKDPTVTTAPKPTSTPSVTPTPVPTPVTPQEDLLAVYFVDAQRGAIMGRGGQLFQTTDGGVQWSIALPLGPLTEPAYIRTASFSPDGSAVAILKSNGDLSYIHLNVPYPTPGIRAQRTGFADPQPNINAIYFYRDDPGWGVGAKGQVFRPENYTLMPQSSGTNLDLYGFFFVNPQQGWIVGDRGLIRSTNDGGQSWQAQTSGTEAKLFGVHFLPDGKTGWVVGWDGTILKTVDGGARWTALTEGAIRNLAYEYSPPRWYYFSWILPALLLFFAVRRREAEELEPEQSIADELVSDRPLEAGDYDPLEFNNIVLGLSRFLRNENTLPPLTIAVTGEWGTGKSSLMNLLRANLRGFGFRPVWFNAWHHQKEEHLLASLLQNVRLQAIPRWWSFAGLSFRMRLLIIRGWRNWLPVLILLFFSALSVGYFVSTYRNGNLSLDNLNASTSALFEYKFSDLLKSGVLLDKASRLTLLLSIIGLLVTIWKGMTAFGVNPASLLASVSRGLRMRDLDAQTSFRQKFAVEFQDVTRALDVRSMIIFIDDLDRCRPENILEALEAVNFLVSSGDCFVVLGMARERVERYVGLSFQDVAEEMIEDSPTVDSQPLVNKENRRKRAEYARQYLDKLINIEVPVPAPSDEQSRELLVGDRTRVRAVKRAGWGRAQTLFMKVWPILIAASVLYAGYQVGQRAFRKDRASGSAKSSEQSSAASTSSDAGATPASPTSTITSTTTANLTAQQNSNVSVSNSNVSSNANVTATNRPSESNNNFTPAFGDVSRNNVNANADRTQPWAALESETEQRKQTQRAEITAPQSGRDLWAYWSLLPLSILILIAAYWLVTRRPDLVIKDSEAFEKALDTWHLLIFSRQTTPRSLKRFMNRVRYLAMRQRRQEDRLPLWKRIIARIEGRANTQESKEDSRASGAFIPESILVALAAIQQFDPRLIEDARLFKEKIEGLSNNPLASSKPLALKEAIAKHEQEFHNWNSIGSHRESFLSVSADIRVN